MKQEDLWELLVPPLVLEHEGKKAEMCRVFVVDAGNELHCVLNVALLPDAGSWAAVLADLAGHVGRAYQEPGLDAEHVARVVLASARHMLDVAMADQKGEHVRVKKERVES